MDRKQRLADCGVYCAQGETGDQFFIIKEGEAVVYQSTPQGVKTVNRLFKADFFGERALLTQEPRHVLLSQRSFSHVLNPRHCCHTADASHRLLPFDQAPCMEQFEAGERPCRAASIEASTHLKCLVLARDRFVEILGPLYSIMQREKSPAVVTQRLMKLQTKARHHARLHAAPDLLSLRRLPGFARCWSKIRTLVTGCIRPLE